MEKSTNYIPENDVQQMFEMQGRVYAAEVYIRSVTFPDRDVLLAMLGAEPDEVTRLKQKLEETEKELEEARNKIDELESFDEGILVDANVFDCLVDAEDEGVDDFLFDDELDDKCECADLSEEADDNE